jgi:hypothetical protein
MERPPQKPAVPRRKWILMFIVGLIIIVGFLLYAIFTYHPEPICTTEEINEDQAATLIRNYQQHSPTDEKNLYQAYSIGSCHYDMIKQLMDENPDAVAVRLYFGQAEDQQDTLLIACAVDPNTRNVPSKYIVSKAKMAGLCPKFCDETSPLAEPDMGMVEDISIGAPIEPESARKMITWYRVMNNITEGVVKGMVVSREQFAIMQHMKEKQEISGFRIYFGTKSKSDAVFTLVCGTDLYGKDIVADIVVATRQYAGLCPRFCDGPQTDEPRDPNEDIW